MLSVQHLQNLSAFPGDQISSYNIYDPYYPIQKQETVSSSDDEDSYDELEMYENLDDCDRNTGDVSPSESNQEEVLPVENTVEEIKVETGLSEVPLQQEIGENRVNKTVKRKKLRKGRCSKLTDGKNKLIESKGMLLQEEKTTENDQVIITREREVYQGVVANARTNTEVTNGLDTGRIIKQKSKRRHGSCSDKKAMKLKQFIEEFSVSKIRQNDRDLYQCDICSKVFKYKWKVKDHYTIHTGERSYKCEDCGDFFRLKSNLREHRINKHSTERNYICSICNKAYKHAYYLRKHMNKHTNTRFKCDLCGSDFSAKQTVKEHIMYKHLEMGESSITNGCPSKSLTTCMICQKTFSNTLNLNLHMQTHDGTQKFDCDLCGAFFSRRTDRDRHRMRHTGERPFKCYKCDYGCITRGELNTHMLKHSDRSGGQARHKCPYCDKTLVRKNEMAGHIAKVHLSAEAKTDLTAGAIKTGFHCLMCSRWFVSQYELNKHHVAVHKKTFDCQHCGQTFNASGNRNRHIERAHSQESVACNICKKMFKSKANMHDHAKRVHSEEAVACNICNKIFKSKLGMRDHRRHVHK